jgi:hypothetical protein
LSFKWSLCVLQFMQCSLRKACYPSSIHLDPGFEWQARRESNPQPAVLETAALPIELLAFER